MPIKILRDAGASQSLLLPFSDVSFTGTNVLIKGVDSTEFTSIPLYNAHLPSGLASGHVVVGILSPLPFEGVHLLLGNDLAGSKVEVNPLVTDQPSVDPNTDSIEQEIPGLFPSCAVTRSMSQSKSTSDDVTTDVDLADTFISPMINDDIVTNVTNDDLSAKAQMFSRSYLIREQNSDPDVSCLFARSVEESDVSRDPVCFYTKNDVLMRKWRPSDVPADDEWAVKHQINISTEKKTILAGTSPRIKRSCEISDALMNTGASTKMGVQPYIMLSDVTKHSYFQSDNRELWYNNSDKFINIKPCQVQLSDMF